MTSLDAFNCYRQMAFSQLDLATRLETEIVSSITTGGKLSKELLDQAEKFAIQRLEILHQLDQAIESEWNQHQKKEIKQ